MQDTPVQAQQAERSSTIAVTFPLLPRLLALGGAALFALAAWAPWVIVTAAPAGNGVSSSVRLALTPGAVGAPPLNALFPAQGGLIIWSALTVLGIPLAALAWMRARRPIAWLIASGYALWLLATLIFAITSAHYLLQSTDLIYQESTTASARLHFESVNDRVPQIGLWLSGLALLTCLVGLWTLISAARRAAPSAETPATITRPTAQTPGAGTLTFGLVLWAVGFLWLAWASLGCPSIVLVSATCKGITTDGAMAYAILRADVFFDPRVGEFAISILLTIGALLIGVGVWRRGVSTALCGWATIWLVAAAAFGALAWYGVYLVVNDPTQGSWRGESGSLFTAGALLICLIGIGLLWFALLFHRTQTSSA
jgi:hypothetical protein